MKDLVFSGSAITSQVIVRVDALSTDPLTNVTVQEIYGLEDRLPTLASPNATEKALNNAILKIAYSLSYFITLATTYSLTLVIRDTAGTNPVTLHTGS